MDNFTTRFVITKESVKARLPNIMEYLASGNSLINTIGHVTQNMPDKGLGAVVDLASFHKKMSINRAKEIGEYLLDEINKCKKVRESAELYGVSSAFTISLEDITPNNPLGYKTSLFSLNPDFTYLLEIGIIHPSNDHIRNDLEELVGVKSLPETKSFRVGPLKDDFESIINSISKVSASRIDCASECHSSVIFELGPIVEVYKYTSEAGSIHLKFDYKIPVDNQVLLLEKVEMELKRNEPSMTILD